jgi:site-specific recombinase XerD
VVSALAPTLQAFFTDRLIAQRHVSAHTIAAYRDTLRLLLGYAAEHTGQAPSALDLTDLDAPLIGAFLDHLETGRGNSVRTRNARLAAIHSLFRYAALVHPEHAESIARVLAIPPKRFDRALITYLAEPEVVALLAACDQTTWTGRRDHALLLLAVQTGLRISELTGLTRADVHLGAGAHVACHGKGRKDRITPLTSGTVTALRAWLHEQRGDPRDPLFRPAAAPGSAATRSSTASPTTAPAPPSRAHPCGAKRSPHTYSGTPPRCDFCTPASTPASSRFGSATSASRPHRSTCTPTSNSRKRHSPEPDHPTAERADTNRPINSSPGSKPSDYADLASSKPLPSKGSTSNIGIIRTSA